MLGPGKMNVIGHEMTERGGYMCVEGVEWNGGRMDWKPRSTMDCSAWKAEEPIEVPYVEDHKNELHPQGVQYRVFTQVSVYAKVSSLLLCIGTCTHSYHCKMHFTVNHTSAKLKFLTLYRCL